MHADVMPILDTETLGEGKLSNSSHDDSSTLIDATVVFTSSMVPVASSNSNALLR